MPHRRSQTAMRKRLAKRILHATSFRDPELAETVARLAISYSDKVGDYAFIVNVERGEILLDNRGRGTWQQIVTEVKSRIE